MIREPNLVLIGFMATGKSTVGWECAKILGLRFRDSDRLVERRAGKSVAAIFAEDGETEFRSLEASAIKTLAAANPIVLSTGGGAPLNPVNVERLRRTGYIILLWAEPEAVLARIGNAASRPLLNSSDESSDNRVRNLLAIREPVYRSVADEVINTTSLSRGEAVERVVAAYRYGVTIERFRSPV